MATVEAIRSVWMQRTQLTLDKVRYDINVSGPTDGLFRATWFCSACNESGPTTPVSSEAKDVCMEAMIGVCFHHSLFHRC